MGSFTTTRVVIANPSRGVCSVSGLAQPDTESATLLRRHALLSLGGLSFGVCQIIHCFWEILLFLCIIIVTDNISSVSKIVGVANNK